MKYGMNLCILQLTILSIFFVNHCFGHFTEACLDEIIKTNIMLKAITFNVADKSQNGIIKEHELKRYDVEFETLIPKEDKIEEITDKLLIEDSKGISGVFTKLLIPNEQKSTGRMQKEFKIQKIIREVVGFKEKQFIRNDKDVRKLEKKDRVSFFTQEIKKGKRQDPAKQNDYISAMEERKRVLCDYIKKEKENRKSIQMCNPDSTKCILVGLQKTLDALPKVFNNYTAKCHGEICRISLILDHGKVEPNIKPISFAYYDEINSEDNYELKEFIPDEADTSEQTEDEAEKSEQTEDEAVNSGQTEDEAVNSGQTEDEAGPSRQSDEAEKLEQPEDEAGTSKQTDEAGPSRQSDEAEKLDQPEDSEGEFVI